MDLFTSIFSKSKNIKIPKAYDEICTDRLLCMSYLKAKTSKFQKKIKLRKENTSIEYV